MQLPRAKNQENKASRRAHAPFSSIDACGRPLKRSSRRGLAVVLFLVTWACGSATGVSAVSDVVDTGDTAPPPLVCAPDDLAPIQNPDEGSALVMARTGITPRVAMPGQWVTVTVSAEVTVDSALTVGLGASASHQPVALSSWKGESMGCVSVVAPSAVGDYWVSVSGDVTSRRGDEPMPATVGGGALLQVRTAAACAPDELWEAGQCVQPTNGHVLVPHDFLGVGAEDRAQAGNVLEGDMVHPRSAHWLDGQLVGCHTRYVFVTDGSAMQQFPETPGSGLTPAPPGGLASVPLQDAGLGACEDGYLQASNRLFISVSRGDSGVDGGLAAWWVPPSDDGVPMPVELRDVIVDAGGVEGVNWTGDRLWALGKPNRLLNISVEPDGTLDTLSELPVADLIAGFDVVADGDGLFVSDAGVSEHLHADGAVHEHGGGQVLWLGQDGTVRAAVDVPGPARGLVMLEPGRVAVATGTQGIHVLHRLNDGLLAVETSVDTPGSAVDLSWSDGYLMASDWQSIRLYDTTQPGLLAMVDAADFTAYKLLGMPGTVAQRRGLRAANRTNMVSGGAWLITEFDAVVGGQRDAGGVAARLLVDTRRVSVPLALAGVGVTKTIVVSNGGRSPLWVAVAETQHIGSDGPRVVAPGETAALEVSIANVSSPADVDRIQLLSNDGDREVALLVLSDTYVPGDLAPPMVLPETNHCADGVCVGDVTCLVLAFFSTW